MIVEYFDFNFVTLFSLLGPLRTDVARKTPNEVPPTFPVLSGQVSLNH